MMWSLTVQAGKAEQSQTVFPNMLENHPLQDVKCQKGDLEFYRGNYSNLFHNFAREFLFAQWLGLSIIKS